MNGLNDYTCMGTVGADAAVNHLDGGNCVANFSIAINDSYMPKNGGERVQTTEWIKVEAWGKLAEFIERFGKKGTSFLVKGRLKTDTYVKDINGQETTFKSTKVVADKILFTEGKNNTAAPAPSAPATVSAPVQVVPVQAAPVQAAPVQAAPAQAAPAQAATAIATVNNENFVNATEGDDLPF